LIQPADSLCSTPGLHNVISQIVQVSRPPSRQPRPIAAKPSRACRMLRVRTNGVTPQPRRPRCFGSCRRSKQTACGKPALTFPRRAAGRATSLNLRAWTASGDTPQGAREIRACWAGRGGPSTDKGEHSRRPEKKIPGESAAGPMGWTTTERPFRKASQLRLLFCRGPFVGAPVGAWRRGATRRPSGPTNAQPSRPPVRERSAPGAGLSPLERTERRPSKAGRTRRRPPAVYNRRSRPESSGGRERRKMVYEHVKRVRAPAPGVNEKNMKQARVGNKS